MKFTLLIFFGITLLVSSMFEHSSAQTQNENFRVNDPSFKRQNLQTGETFTVEGSLTAIIIEGLGAILIVAFIIIYAIKKKSKGETNDKS